MIALSLSLTPDYEYVSSISICIFSSFHFRKQLPIETGAKKSRQQVIVSCACARAPTHTHTHTQAQARGLTDAHGGGRQCTCWISLGSISSSWALPLLATPCSRGETGGPGLARGEQWS